MPLNAKAPTMRDSRIDWLRGFALACIFVNHMPGNRLGDWTPRNFGFSDAAELFVLLAGVAAALAFYRRFEDGQALRMSGKAIRRAGTLYLAHLGSSVAAIGILLAANWYFRSSEIDDLVGATALFEDPLPGLLGMTFGGYQIGYFNILPLYVVLLLALPGYLFLARINRHLMLAAAVVIYFVGRKYALHLPSYPVDHGWYFNPFAWQLLYATGVYLGILKIKGATVPWHPVAGALALAYVLYALAWCVFHLSAYFDTGVSLGLLPVWVETLSKPALPMSRYLHVLALAYLLLHSRVWTWMLRISDRDALVLMGRHALPVFVVGSLLSLVGLIVLANTGPSLALEAALTVGGLAIMITIALYNEYGLAPVRRRLTRTSDASKAASEISDDVTVRTR